MHCYCCQVTVCPAKLLQYMKTGTDLALDTKLETHPWEKVVPLRDVTSFLSGVCLNMLGLTARLRERN